MPSPNRKFRRNTSRRRGFTLIELVLVVLILSIVSVLSVDAIATFVSTQKADLASREALGYFRFARHLAMTTGNNAKVQIDTTNNTLSVYLMSNGTTWDATPYAASFAAGGTMQINLNTERELQNTTMSTTPAGTTAYVYNSVGTCATAGTVTFTYASKAKILTVPAVGDPH